MADTIIIKQKFTANTVTTSVKLPGKPPMSKQWKRVREGFLGSFGPDWSEEPGVPTEVARAAEDLHTAICDEMKGRATS